MTRNDLKKGDYVLATKWGDGDPCDHFCVGFFREMLREESAGDAEDRYLVEDARGQLFRANGFRRCERISHWVGDIVVSAMPLIGNRPGRSLWYWRFHPSQLESLIREAKP